ncbi:Bug family tripartite tricarboxylate transporter substrate binding protein [Piscinibacter koreensis]|uniref:Tripartite tricarboxylate transporter substrate binding protein n=1 Tax=Piscinibacter koreensis TaxID=2742824 RepID=A0A7Y6TWJ5_9BURK|nr:tripartite tricarboxylate transporter substrate binding protein [Schlegelella koreensis]NUZ06092.1 tripartite tricarboxylate transporter substrate binding protein [Schlegelella koreensis]
MYARTRMPGARVLARWAAPLALAFGVLAAPNAHAQNSAAGEPTRLIVGFAAGGGTDVAARLVAEPLAKKLGTTIVVDNKPGGGGVLAMTELKKSAPDGRTLLMSSTGTLVMLPHLQKVPFDIQKDITYLGTVVQYPLVIVVPPQLGVRTLRDFVAYSKRNPGKLAYSSAGIGTGNHFAAEVLKKETGIDIAHVPYKSDGAALPDLMEGRVQMHVINIQVALQHIKSGKLVALAVTGASRLPDLPDVPTVAEAGYPAVEQAPWTAVIGPAGIPPDTAARISAALAEVLADPELRKKFAALGQDVAPRNPAETRTFVGREYERYKAVAAAANMKVE